MTRIRWLFFLRAVICETGCARRFPLRGRQRCPGVVGAALLVGCRAALGAWAVWGTGYGVRRLAPAPRWGWVSACVSAWPVVVPGAAVAGGSRCRCGARSRVVRCCRGMLSDVPLFVRLWGSVGVAEPGAGCALGRRPVVRCGCGVREGAGQGWNGPISVREFRCPVRGWSDRVRFGTVGPNRRTSYFQPA